MRKSIWFSTFWMPGEEWFLQLKWDWKDFGIGFRYHRLGKVRSLTIHLGWLAICTGV